MTQRSDVQRLIDLGFDIFPCYGLESPKVKQPKTLGRDWRDGPPPEGWQWEASDLIGVNLPVGTVVLDVDDPGAFKASRLEPAASVFSGTRRDGGLHIFYRTSAEAPQVTDKERGYDTRVGGLGYVIAWDPSIWTAPSEWAMAPAWLYDRPRREVRETGPGETMVTRLDILSFLGRLAEQGSLSKDDYYRLLLGRREAGVIVAGDPRRPWTDEDLRELAHEASKWPPAVQLQITGKNLRTPQGDRIRVITDYLRGVPHTIPWIVDKFAYLGGVTILAGAPKAGKSTLAFDLMRARETGTDFLGGTCAPGPTLLVTEEGGVPIRFKGGTLSELFVYDQQASEGEPFDATLRVVGEWAKEHPGGLVFIDTLAVWAGVEDENSSAEMTKAIKLVKQLLADPYQVAVVLVHHTRKGGGKDGEAIRGSGAILATVDHVVELKRTSEDGSTERILDVMSRVLDKQETWRIDWNPLDRKYTRIEMLSISAKADRELAGVPRDGAGVTRDYIERLGTIKTNLKERLLRFETDGYLRVTRPGGTKPNLYWRKDPGEPLHPDDDDENDE